MNFSSIVTFSKLRRKPWLEHARRMVALKNGYNILVEIFERHRLRDKDVYGKTIVTWIIYR